MRRTRRMQGIGSRMVGWLVSYALALSLVLVGALDAQMAVGAADGLAGFEICHPGSASAPETPAPTDHAGGKFHCVLCTAVGAGAVMPPACAALAAPVRVGAALQIVPGRALPHAVTYLRQPVRGPPAA